MSNVVKNHSKNKAEKNSSFPGCNELVTEVTGFTLQTAGVVILMLIIFIPSMVCVSRHMSLQAKIRWFDETEASQKIRSYTDKLFQDVISREELIVERTRNVNKAIDELAMRTLSDFCFHTKNTNENGLARDHVWKRFYGSNKELCETTTEGGGWLIFQKNRPDQNHGIFSKQDWSSYRDGFGHPDKDNFWIGLQFLSELTEKGEWELLLKMKWIEGKFAGQWGYLKYSGFQIKNEENKFEIDFEGSTRSDGNLPGDKTYVPTESKSLTAKFNEQPFTLKNGSHEVNPATCAKNTGGWWYGTCSDICLNCDAKGRVYVEYDEKGDEKTIHVPELTQMALRPKTM